MHLDVPQSSTCRPHPGYIRNEDVLVPITYTVVTPLLKPLVCIGALWNKGVAVALGKSFPVEKKSLGSMKFFRE